MYLQFMILLEKFADIPWSAILLQNGVLTLLIPSGYEVNIELTERNRVEEWQLIILSSKSMGLSS